MTADTATATVALLLLDPPSSAAVVRVIVLNHEGTGRPRRDAAPRGYSPASAAGCPSPQNRTTTCSSASFAPDPSPRSRLSR
jgi:hypothetical protein